MKPKKAMSEDQEMTESIQEESENNAEPPQVEEDPDSREEVV
jgi:hypothetical protein